MRADSNARADQLCAHNNGHARRDVADTRAVEGSVPCEKRYQQPCGLHDEYQPPCCATPSTNISHDGHSDRTAFPSLEAVEMALTAELAQLERWRQPLPQAGLQRGRPY